MGVSERVFGFFACLRVKVSRITGLIVSNDGLEFRQSLKMGIMVAFLMKTLPFILFLLPNLFPLTTLFFVVGFSLNFEKLVSADLDYCPFWLNCRNSEFKLPLSQNLCVFTSLATLLDILSGSTAAEVKITAAESRTAATGGR